MKRTFHTPFSFHVDLDEQSVYALATALLKASPLATNRVRAAGHRHLGGTLTLWSLLLICLVGFFPVSLRAQTIAIDGDPSDWPAVLEKTGYVTAFKIDNNNTNDDQFTGGSSDPDPIARWSWNFGNTNDKGDITNAGAALIGSNLYFFGDRTAINGSAQIGFWFFKGGVAPISGGKFSGAHVVGDILVLSNFTNGGGAVNLGIYKWVGSRGNAGGGTLDFLGTTKTAAVNSRPWDVPRYPTLTLPSTWAYTPKVGTGYVTGSFFEGKINLKDPALNIVDACFTNFLLETRNSSAVNASLQDLAAGEFNVTPKIYTLTPTCLLYTSPSPRDLSTSRMPSSA